MPTEHLVKDIMIPLTDYPHIPLRANKSKQFTTGEFFSYGWIANVALMVVLAIFCFLVWPMMDMPVVVAN